jgi:hypothetical protein
MLLRGWDEFDHRVDMCHVTQRALQTVQPVCAVLRTLAPSRTPTYLLSLTSMFTPRLL